LTRHDLFNADESFLTGTGAEIIAVVKIDGRVIGHGKPGPVTQKLVTQFRQLTQVFWRTDITYSRVKQGEVILFSFGGF